ncbi:unnamed protein product [Clonostachys chloroleuca]|uniref:Uncharacterized protein n=1 Tax=Clonostachys chloroleuca TaxID=1926264 RepID=A0AA35Q3M0_9HYPO|nr:unnamed protein product [Clonostachys chloroleuca]
MDSFLVENQGLQATKPQRGDLSGLKCWRQTTAELSVSSILPDEVRHCSGTEAALPMIIHAVNCMALENSSFVVPS